MAFQDVVNTLRQEEQQLAKQLSNVRAALTALGSNLTYVVTGRGRKPGRPAGSTPEAGVSATGAASGGRKRRKLSAKARKAISDAQKARWAKLKAGKK